jgi:prevent-host-death family protein
METVSVQEARKHIGELLDRVAVGEEIVISRRGKPVARLTPIGPPQPHFPDRKPLREALPPGKEASATTVRQLRDDERY